MNIYTENPRASTNYTWMFYSLDQWLSLLQAAHNPGREKEGGRRKIH